MINRTISIPLSKGKLTLGLIGAIAFVALGVWLILHQPATNNIIFENAVKNGIGILSILFFGLMAFLYAKKLSDRKPGIIIDSEGITDNSSASLVGIIPWTDIITTSIEQAMKQKFLMVHVKNPEHYIAIHKSKLKQKALQFNYKRYGAPIAISANGLQCNFKELQQTIEEQLTANKAIS